MTPRRDSIPAIARERDILEGAVRTLADQAAKADALANEAVAAGLVGSHPVTLSAKHLRLELLQVKGDLERELGRLVLDCIDCGRTVHWVSGLGVTPGHWAHREPAPHGDPAMQAAFGSVGHPPAVRDHPGPRKIASP